MSQSRKIKAKPSRQSSRIENQYSSQMMTEQEQKMFYTNKQRNDQQSRQGQNLTAQKGLKNRNLENSIQNEEDINLSQIQLSNLNQNSAEEITEFINKLIAKNKVSSKNAFDIPLIHLQQMEDYRASLNENTWKRLSSTLQNDYKIYGYRVDATHTITYKMLQSIARHETSIQESLGLQRLRQHDKDKQNQPNMQSNDEFMSSFIDKSFSSNVQKNKMNVDYTKHIQKNQRLINVTHVQSFFGCNPGLQRTKRKFDQQGFKALLLNNIPLQNGCQLKLDQQRKYHSATDDLIKKEALEPELHKQNRFMFEDQANQLFEQIFCPNVKQNRIELENQNLSNIFTQIYELNIYEGKANKDDFTKFQRLYKIVSGQDKQQKKYMMKIKPTQKLDVAIQQEIPSIPDPQNANLQIAQNRQLSVPYQEDIQQLEVNIEHEQKGKDFSPNSANIVYQAHQNNTIVEEKPSIDVQRRFGQNDNDQHPLVDGDFKMHEVNLESLQQEYSSPSHNNDTSQYLGKFRNIEQYIKIKQPRAKIQRKNKLQMDSLSYDQIGKQIFNRKVNKKKIDLISKKDSASLKQEDSNGNSRHGKIDFRKIQLENRKIKRSAVFKKSVAQERTFNQIKSRIRQRLEESHQNVAEQKNQMNKRKKKTHRTFDLPLYEFEKGDVNFIDTYQQMDPDTNQSTYSSLYKEHYPSFVFSVNEIKNKFQKNRLQKQRLNQKINVNTDLTAQDNQPNHQNEQLLQSNYISQPNLQTIQENPEQIDISFIYDQMGQIRGGNQQVAIRQAKQKMKKIMLGMFSKLESKKRPKKKQVSFKQIYESYYRQQGFISPALCFLTVLHLANEHNLILEGKQDGTDFKILVESQNKMNSSNFIKEASKDSNVYLNAMQNQENCQKAEQESKISDSIIEEQLNFA